MTANVCIVCSRQAVGISNYMTDFRSANPSNAIARSANYNTIYSDVVINSELIWKIIYAWMSNKNWPAKCQERACIGKTTPGNNALSSEVLNSIKTATWQVKLEISSVHIFKTAGFRNRKIDGWKCFQYQSRSCGRRRRRKQWNIASDNQVEPQVFRWRTPTSSDCAVSAGHRGAEPDVRLSEADWT